LKHAPAELGAIGPAGGLANQFSSRQQYYAFAPISNPAASP